jgi:hypothetical protein
MDSLEEYLDQHDIKQIEDITEEYDKLMVWFQKDYPEGTMRLDVNSDQRVGVLTYKLTIISGKELNDDQKLITNEVKLDMERFTNIPFMDKFKKGINTTLKKNIIKMMNDQFSKGV